MNEENKVVEQVVEDAVNQAMKTDNIKKGIAGLVIAFAAGLVVAGPVKKLAGKIFKKKEVVADVADETTDDDEESSDEE